MTGASLPDQARIDDELADWLVAHDRGLSESEQAAFDTWLRVSPAHELAWAEAATLWESFDEAGQDETLSDMLDEARNASPDRPWIQRHGLAVATGGGLLAAAAAALLFLGPVRAPAPLAPPALESRFATRDHAETFRLADGTRLELDAGSALTFASGPAERTARLEQGRAFLDVHHDAARPFRVEAAGATITDVGTAFGVSADGHGLTVSLASGKVAIADPASGNDPVSLSPGQQFRRIGDRPGIITKVDPASALAWREGYLEFDRTPLTQAIADMNRYTDKPITITDPKIGALLVSGRFKTGDPARFARLLALTYPVMLSKDHAGHPTLEPAR